MRLHLDRQPWPDLLREVRAEMKAGAADRMEQAVEAAHGALVGQLSAGLKGGSGFARFLVDWWSSTAPTWSAHGYVRATGPRARAMVDGFAEGSVVRSENGYWLAIPLPAVPRSGGNRLRRMTPAEVERRIGRLHFRLAGRVGLLVLKDMTPALSGSGYRPATAGRVAQGRVGTPIPMFLLVPQAHLPRRLDLGAAAEKGLETFG